MTEKDIRAMYKRETGVYVPELPRTDEPDITNYLEWLERQYILLEKEVYDLKLEKLRQNWTSQNRAH